MSIQPIRLKFYVKNDFQILQEGVEKSVTYMSYGLERVKEFNAVGHVPANLSKSFSRFLDFPKLYNTYAQR